MRKTITFPVLLCASVMLSACATTQNLSMEDKRNIRTVSVDKHIDTPANMSYLGPGFGYIGLLSAIPSYTDSKKIKGLADNNGIQIKEIIEKNMAEQLHNMPGHIKVAKNNKADADLKVHVIYYGFSIPQGFSLSVAPIMRIDAELIKNNRVVWKNHAIVDALLSDMPTYKVYELESNPAAIRTAWNLAAKKSVQDLLATLSV